MPVTNFQSVISAQTVGTADIDKLAASFDKVSAAIEGTTKKANTINDHPGFNAFAEKIKAGIENPLQGISGAAEAALSALGPLGVGAAATSGIFAATGLAIFEAAKSLGEWGVRIRDVELKTGLSAKQVGEFSFAARAVGQDISITERMMRGLTAAIEDNSEKGQKGRDWLIRFGVDMNAVRDGSASTADVLKKVGDGLNGLGNQWEQKAAALALFKRAGIENLPFLLELSDNLDRAKKKALGFDESDVKGNAEYMKHVAEIEMRWDRVLLKLKEVAVNMPKGFAGGWAAGAMARDEANANPTPTGEHSLTKERLAREQVASDAELDAGVRAHVKRLNEALVLGREADKYALGLGKTTQEGFAGAYFGEMGAAGKLYTSYGKISADEAEQRAKFGSTPAWGKISKDFDDQRAAAFIKFITESSEGLRKFNKALDDFDMEHNSPEKDFENRKKLLEKNSEALKSVGLLDEHGNLNLGKIPGPRGTSPEDALRNARDSERRGLSLYGVQASLGGVSEIGQINTMAQMRKVYADKEYDALKRMADLKNDEQAKQDAIDQQHQKYLDAEIERQQALLQLALRQKEEFQNLVVGFADAAMHGGTTNFLKGQGTHLLDQVIGNGAGMAWSSVSKVIPHASDPNSTLGKLLGGTMFGADPMKAATDANTLATADNTMALRAMATSPSGGGGSASGGWGYSPASGGAGSFGDGISGGVGLPADDPNAWMRSSGMSLTKDIGIAAAGAGGIFGAYSGFKAGGAQGALTGSGSLIGAAGAITSLAGVTGPLAPILMGVGMALPLISSILGDPKANRSKDLQTQAQQRAFTMPTGADYRMDSSGRYDDYNYKGQNRTTAVTIYAMDSKSFNDYLMANPTALSNGMNSAITGGNADDVVGSLAARING